VDWSLAHAVNVAVATRDWLEDPVTRLAALAVPVFVVVAVGMWLLARPYGSERWKRASVSALGAAGLALLVDQVVSHTWQRPRPFTTHPLSDHLLAPATSDPSFPGDHAAAAFAIAVAVLLLAPRAGAALVALASFVAFSRVALGVDYPTDVVAGAIIGAVSATVLRTIGVPWVDGLVRHVSRATDPVYAKILASARRR
jgi:undecaprenyl-diphosphatase